MGSFPGKILPNSEFAGNRYNGSPSPAADLNATTCSTQG